MQTEAAESDAGSGPVADSSVGPDRKDLLGEGESVSDNPNATDGGPSVATNIISASKGSAGLMVGGLLVVGLVFGYFWLKPNKPAPEALMSFERNKPQTAGSVQMPTLMASSSPAGASTLLSPTEQKPTPVVTPSVREQALPPSPLPITLPDTRTATTTAETGPAVQSLMPKTDSKQPAAGAQGQGKQQSAPIMLLNGGGSGGAGGGKDAAGALDQSSASGNFVPALSSASNVQVTKVGDMALTITQGHIIDAVLETPVNTQNSSPVRALISREVYADKGSNILIPKGSRLIGTLTSGYTPGSTKVMISWTRIIMPNGFDINVAGSPAVGSLGGIGIEGFVDRQFLETVGSAALLSVVNIGAAKVIQDKFNIKPGTTQTTVPNNPTSNGGGTVTTTTISPTSQAAESELQNLSSTTQAWYKQNFNPAPYIVLDQGTRVKVFVNQDIHFPKNLGTSGLIK